MKKTFRILLLIIFDLILAVIVAINYINNNDIKLSFSDLDLKKVHFSNKLNL